jgi:hypothetical protein
VKRVVKMSNAQLTAASIRRMADSSQASVFDPDFMVEESVVFIGNLLFGLLVE